MSRLKSLLTAPRVNVALFVIAALLLAFSAVGGTRAALTYFSDTYTTRLAVSQIGVTLLENGEEVAWRNYEGGDKWFEGSTTLLASMGSEDEVVNLGQEYPEALAVRNTGEIDQYVRVEVLKYWTSGEGDEAEKIRTVSPSLINLKLAENTCWIVDEAASADERTVLYYTRPIAAGETSEALSTAISIDPAVATKVTQTEGTREEDGKTYTTITTTYDYDGLRFNVEATVDAVQEHNATDAILSAWGKHVTVTDGVLSLEGEAN